MRYVLALLAIVALGTPVSSEESQPGGNLASLDLTFKKGSVQYVSEPIKSTQAIKEGEFETPETIAAIESNHEDRERTIIIDR